VSPLRVVLADDQAVVRDGLALLLSTAEDLEVVATAADGTAAVDMVLAQRPDVALVDLRMPGLDGAQVTEAVRREAPEVRVLVLTTYADDESLFPALEAGARGYLTKDASAEEIEQAIRSVAAGRTHLDPAVQRRLVDAVVSSSAPAAAPPDDLTAREVEILRLIAAGLSNGEIAAALVVSGATVKTHVNHIFAKTGARDRAQAVRYAYEHGLA